MNGASRIPCRISAGWRTGRTARAPSAAAAAPARAALPLPGSAARRLRDGGRAGGPSLAGGLQRAAHRRLSRLQMSIRQGRRCSAATAYLRPALRRPNLRVETGAHVLGLDFDGDRATGCAICAAAGSRRRGRGARSSRRRRDQHASHPDAFGHRAGASAGTGRPVGAAGPSRRGRQSAGPHLGHRDGAAARAGPFVRELRLDRIGRSMVRAYLGGEGFAGDVPGGWWASCSPRAWTRPTCNSC